jgi:hypothetical protein
LAAFAADIAREANNAIGIFFIFLLRSLRARNNSPIANSNDYYFINAIAKILGLINRVVKPLFIVEK